MRPVNCEVCRAATKAAIDTTAKVLENYRRFEQQSREVEFRVGMEAKINHGGRQDESLYGVQRGYGTG